jgi:Ni,Fe-hydrogenase III small subunit
MKFQPSTFSRRIASAYMAMPEARIVIIANRMALRPRVFSLKRSFRYSGTDLAFEP